LSILNKSLCGVFVQSQANGEWLVAILGLKLVEVGFQVELVEKERKKKYYRHFFYRFWDQR